MVNMHLYKGVLQGGNDVATWAHVMFFFIGSYGDTEDQI